MPEPIVGALLWFNAIGSALIAGLFFAFSTFIMTALGRIEPRAGIAAMNAINTTILRSMFMPIFLSTTLVAAILAIAAAFDLSRPGAMTVMGAGAVYVFGMFVCTMALNVPLNNALADPAKAESLWPRYLREWTAWNHVRTIASTAACTLYILAIAAQ